MAKAKKNGRPKIEFDAGEVERLASIGLTQSQIADYFGATDRTLRNRLQDDVELYSAYQKGKAKGLAKVSGKLWEKIESGDNTAIIFYLKTQGGWSETQKHELTGRDGGPIEHSDIPEQERVERIARLLDRARARRDGEADGEG